MSSATLKMLITLLFLTVTIHTCSAQQTPYTIWQACTVPGFTLSDEQQCIDTLLTYPTLVSAVGLYDIAIGIIGIGIPVSKDMSAHLHRALRKPNLPKRLHTILNECSVAYDSVIPSFQTALGYMTRKEYANASSAFLIITTKFMAPCVKTIHAYGTRDQFLLKTNLDVKMLSLSAYEAASELANGKFIIHTDQHGEGGL